MKWMIRALAILAFVFITSFLIYIYWKDDGLIPSPQQHETDDARYASDTESKPWYVFPFFSKKPEPKAEEVARRNNFLVPKRFSARYIQGTGHKIDGIRRAVGYGTDHGTVAALFAGNYHPGHVLPLMDLRAEGFINNTYGGNIGVGGRYIPKPDQFCMILGFNTYYDWRVGFNGPYNQVGLGLELLGKRWDFRANGYIPLGSKGKASARCSFDSYGNCKHCHKFFAIPFAFNFEVGYLAIERKKFLLYIATGPYFFGQECLKHPFGMELRMRPQYKDYVALDLMVRYDSVFLTVFQAEIIFYWPLYRKGTQRNKRIECGISERQIYQPIERFEVMPLRRRSHCD